MRQLFIALSVTATAFVLTLANADPPSSPSKTTPPTTVSTEVVVPSEVLSNAEILPPPLGKLAPAGKGHLEVKGIAVPELLIFHLPEVFKKRHGLLICEVTPNSSAEKSGLVPGQVLLSIAKQPIVVEQFAKLVEGIRTETVEATVLHAGKVVTLELRIDRKPVPSTPRNSSFAFSSATKSGEIRVVGVNGQLLIEVDFRDERGALHQERFAGTWKEVEPDLRRLPQALGDQIRQRMP